jgi:serine/threonine protein kinase
MVDLNMTIDVGTPLYMAPELTDCEGYDNSIDVFSFGFMAWELITERSLCDDVFSGKRAIGIAMALQGGKRPPIPPGMDSRVADCLQKCWNAIPSERPTFARLAEILRDIDYKVRPGVDTEEVAKYAAEVEDDEQWVARSS